MAIHPLEPACIELVRQFIHNLLPLELEFDDELTGDWILPPFLGEMGIEIQFYISAIEPWLRSGWKVLTKRPELYPQGAAIYNREIFDEIEKFSNEHHLFPMMSRLSICDAFGAMTAKHSVDGSDHEMTVVCSDSTLKAMINRCQIEKKLRAIAAKYILHKRRPSTIWDQWLTSLHTPWDDFTVQVTTAALVPSFTPELYLRGTSRFGAHIGVQLRNYGNPIRNSNPDTVMPLARRAASLLNLPILFYGPSEGTVAVEGYPRTLQYVDKLTSLLSVELNELTSCKIMFAPDSGWADLMAWLRIPTVIEAVGNGTHQRLKYFDPIFLAANQIIDFESEVKDILDVRNRCVFSTSESSVHPVYVPAGLRNRAFSWD